LKAYKIRVVGVVQGVGFRPFVYRLAKSLNLKGYVVNLGGSEVEVHVEGDESYLREFLARMPVDKPPQAKIISIKVEEVEPLGFSDFIIKESERRTSSRSMIPPDIAICDYCVKEIFDVNSRFYMYPWNSCAWCGPRFSMLYDIPYDRVNTAMSKFKLCDECSRDYSDPGNTRRFHGQGISCPKCGIRTYIFTIQGARVDVEDPVGFIADRILEGHIVAIKGVGGYHIACLASRDEVVAELRSRKRRPTQPFALMARDFNVVLEIADPPPGARELLESPQRPIVVMPRKRGSRVSRLVAPGLSTIGVMLPYTGFQVLLLNRIPDGFLIMTSGNPHGKPMCTNLECVFSELQGIVDYVVEHDRDIVHRVDDSVVRFTDGDPVLLRRGRGYAPEWIEVSWDVGDALAVGAELQTAGAVSFENKVVLTQFIGDIDEPAQLDDLRRELLWLARVYKVKPEVVAMDKHPLYHNRRLARELAGEYGAKLVEVQHHHAHAASVMGELGVGLDEKVVAVTIDGTGYGDDGGIWGGEVLVSTFKSYRRVGSLRPFILPGGDSAALYPVKPLIALLALAGYSESELLNLLERLGLLSSLPYGTREALLTYTLARMERGALVTSLGRVLDAFSALLGACTLRTYEGEPPMRLEALADEGVDRGFTPRIVAGDGRLLVDSIDMLEWAMKEVEKGLRREDVAVTVLKGFGRALASIALKAIKGMRNTRQIVIATGGAAVNTHIVRGMREVLREEDLRVVLPRKLPAGDGGIALGQILIAGAQGG
jgi:hydrogenase maturation protein HypF